MSRVNALVPSAPAEILPSVRTMVDELEKAAKERPWKGVELWKLVGQGKDGKPDYPKITLRAEINGYGQPVASVTVQQTATNHHDFAGSLEDLDVRTACEYYIRLNSADAVDAVEKVIRAPTPRAWAFITLLDTVARMNFNKEIET